MEQLMYRPVEAAQVLGIGRTRVFALIKSGRLRSVKLGAARLSPRRRCAHSSATWSRNRPVMPTRRWRDAYP
jgi:excisionase family DNA binding protein